MAQRLFITATDTEVGKTYVTCGLLGALLRAKVSVGVVKPFATGCREVDGYLVSEDAERYAEVLEGVFKAEALNDLCLYSYRAPLSPYAAQLSGEMPTRIEWDEVAEQIRAREQGVDCLLIEGIGGVAVPVSGDRRAVELAVAAQAQALVVARSGLGTINHTVLTVESLQTNGVDVVGFVFNNARPEDRDPSVAQNAEIIREMTGVSYLGCLPHGTPIRAMFDELVKKLQMVGVSP